MKFLSRGLWTAFSLLLLALPASAQRDGGAPADVPAGAFAEVIDVRVVNLEAVVVDRQGNRVSGLKPEDFTLKVDGREVPFQYFSEIVAGRAREPSGEPSEAVQGVPGLDPGKPVGTSYLVFIDNVFAFPQERNRVIDGLLEDLPLMGQEDRMAIVAFDGGNLRQLQVWSNDIDKLSRAFREAKRLKGFGFRNRADLNDLQLAETFAAEALDFALNDGPTVGGGGAANLSSADFGLPGRGGPRGVQDVVTSDARWAIQRLERRIERVSYAARTTLRAYARPPGRKVMLLLSGGWPQNAVQYVTQSEQPVIGYGELKGPEMLDTIHETANLLGYTLYPIDVAGRNNGSDIDADEDFRNANLPLQREIETHFTLRELAGETGGRALIDGARLASFQTVMEDTRSYYWLGFVPDWQGDDREHKVKLTVNQPGFRVRSREGFQDLSKAQEVTFMVESAVLFGDVPGSERLQVELGTPDRNRRRVELPISITIPMDDIVMLPVKNGYRAELELRVAVLDQRGNRNDMPVIPVVLQGPAEPQPGQVARYDTAIKLRELDQTVVVALHDPLSGTILFHKETYDER